VKENPQPPPKFQRTPSGPNGIGAVIATRQEAEDAGNGRRRTDRLWEMSDVVNLREAFETAQKRNAA
jgi:hypothetical protein